MTWRPCTDTEQKTLVYNASLLSITIPGDCSTVCLFEHDGEVLASAMNPISLEPERLKQWITQHGGALSTHAQHDKRLMILFGMSNPELLSASLALLQTFPKLAIAMMEPQPARALATLSQARVDETVASRLMICVGEQARNELIRRLDVSAWFLNSPRDIAHVLGSAPHDSDAQEMVECARHVARQIGSMNNEFGGTVQTFMQEQTAPRPITSLWSCTNRQSYIHYPLMQAMLRGFAAHDIKTHSAPFQSGYGEVFRAVRNLVETNPDAIMQINTLPTAFLLDMGFQAEAITTMKTPRLCWLVDDTMLYEDDRDSLNVAGNDFVFICDRNYKPHLHTFTDNIFFLPPATQFEQPGTPREAFRAPISYVGSIPWVEQYLHALSGKQRDILDAVEQQKSRNPTSRFTAILKQCAPMQGDQQAIQQQAQAFCDTTHKQLSTADAILEYFLFATATYIKRKRIVEALLPIGLRVFGPDRWLAVLGPKYADRYGGFIENRDLADCYASAQLSLNIHSHQCPTCLNTRDFDVPAAGGICLSDWVDDMNLGMLEPGRDVLTFHETEEATELAKHFIADTDLRDSLAQHAQQHVFRDHTYAQRAASVLRILSSKFPQYN